MSRTPRDIATLRARLDGLQGEAWWQGLEALSQGSEAWTELGTDLTQAATALDRREFLRLMAASLAMAGLTACGRPPEQAVVRARHGAAAAPGTPRWYASAVVMAGIAQPVLGKTVGARPIKLEGNPEHPAAAGACDAFTQAAILQLYDPDRSQVPRYKGRETSWVDVTQALAALAQQLDGNAGKGLHILCGASSSPTLGRQLGQLLQRWPQVQVYDAEPFSDREAIEVAEQAFGQALEQRRYLDRAQVVVCLEDDLLDSGPRQTLWQRGWAERRRQAQRGQGQALLFVAQSRPNLTGAAATRRLAVAPSRLLAVTLALCKECSVPIGEPGALGSHEQAWVDAVAQALQQAGSAGLVCAGRHAPGEVQAAVLRLNQHLGNQGNTLDWQPPVLLGHDRHQRWLPLARLQQALDHGEVQQLLFVDCNPVYGAPASFPSVQAVQRVPLRLHMGLYFDETAVHCHWHLPLSHGLESWSDARSANGGACIVQPLIEPLYATRTVHQLLALLLGNHERDALQLVRETWRDLPEAAWREALERGWVDTAVPVVQVPTARTYVAVVALTPPADMLEAIVRPDPSVWDGRFANLGWLQELPKPISTLTWSNVIGIAPALAERLGISNGDGLQVLLPGQVVRGAAWVEPGQAETVVALYAGYGREQAGSVGNGLGYAVRPLTHAWHGATLSVEPREYPLAMTQAHHRLPADELPAVRTVSRNNDQLPLQTLPVTQFMPAETSGPQWGMVIDLDLCTGCNACVTACQAENNIPVVGARQVALGRSMHWLRIDHYYHGSLDAPRSFFQPLPCMHCEQAPCETACPVSATVHSHDGLNQMVYNRCIGTRTCASYCPYKVRRFNWLDWNADAAPSIEAQRNPQVSVRSRGVMEKCSYCIQRISAARIEHKLDEQTDAAAPVLTACQQTCPSQAIAFGDIADASSEVSQARAGKRHYRLLDGLGTRPRTSYLAQILDAEKP